MAEPAAARSANEDDDRSALQAVSGDRIDLKAAEAAVAALLRALGLDERDPVLAGTPRRLAKAYAELLTPRPVDLTTFPNDEQYDELVLVREIPFTSVCEHHLLPFVGVAHVAYLPGDRIIGLSKIARVVELHARAPQVQERLTMQIATWLTDQVHARGVGVVLEAEHSCMSLRGVQARGARTVTSAMLGSLRDDVGSRAEFFALTGVAAR